MEKEFPASLRPYSGAIDAIYMVYATSPKELHCERKSIYVCFEKRILPVFSSLIQNVYIPCFFFDLVMVKMYTFPVSF